MDPINNIVSSLLETPISRWKDYKKFVFSIGKLPTLLAIRLKKEKNDMSDSVNFCHL